VDSGDEPGFALAGGHHGLCVRWGYLIASRAPAVDAAAAVEESGRPPGIARKLCTPSYTPLGCDEWDDRGRSFLEFVFRARAVKDYKGAQRCRGIDAMTGFCESCVSDARADGYAW
jgi:hypothetical protein